MKRSNTPQRSFTPGPWLVESRTVYALNELEENRFYATVQTGRDNSGQMAQRAEILANVHLMAASPDLLHALDCIVWWHSEDKGEIPTEFWDQAREALKKASGE